MGNANVDAEFKKHQELRIEDLENLKEWSKKQLHLPHLSEMHLVIFLHSCYWSIEKAKLKIDKFFTYRKALPQFFAHRDPKDPKMLSDMEVALFTYLPDRSPENHKIFFLRLIDEDVSRYDFTDQLKILDMNLIYEIMENETCEGLIIVCDMEGFSISHFLKTHVTEVKKFVTYLQEALPARIAKIHLTNLGPIVDMFIPLIKPFIKKELLQILCFTESFERLTKYIPKECFPDEYGGLALPINDLHLHMRNTLLLHRDYYVNSEKFVTDETLRDRRPSYLDRDLGVGAIGSFKQIPFA